MNKRLRTSSQADAKESSAPGLSLDEHTTVIMSRSFVVERHIQLVDFYELRFEDRTLPEIVEQAGWLRSSRGPARREEPAQGTEEQDLGQGSSQGLEGQRPSWVASMMTELTEQMRAIMQPTHEMVGNISSRLSTLELKVVSMDAELKKQVSEVQLALKSVATSAELVALTERVVLLEEHMSDVWAVLHLSDD
ncbi:hypothetical protein CJ030_MR1G018146 [Morella rubra]|uniref:Uncharacterized protein n=1 Tax=Morella rubra TaxID=262757 RepID=A0A6A1WMI6_9ROSI|nr:hypothetical protein CJ030_MR1G018146 [Morella rubra]